MRAVRLLPGCRRAVLLLAVLCVCGIEADIAQGAPAESSAKAIHTYTKAQALEETSFVLERIKTAWLDPKKQPDKPARNSESSADFQQEDEGEPPESPVDEEEDLGSTEDDEDSEAAYERLLADRRKLSELRSLLALDESRRSIPVALDGYQQLYSRLRSALHDPAAESSNPTKEDLQLSDALHDNATDSDFPDHEDVEPGLIPLGEATFELAVLTLTGLAGTALPRDDEAGLEMLRDAAEAGSIDAHLALSHRHLQGLGMPKNCDLAFEHGRQAARFFIDQAEAAGAFQPPVEPVLLRERWRNADFLMPLPGLMQQAGEGGEPQADTWGVDDQPVNLFELMHRDHGGGAFADWQWLPGFPPLAAEPETTLQMLHRLAAQGDGEALFNLGYMHLRGIDVQKNASAAFFLFTASVVKRFPAAYNALGVMYHNGHDLPQDFGAARQLFEAGAARGDVDSMYNLGTLHLAGHGVEKDAAVALKHFQDANENQHWQAPFQLALLHYEGEGTEQDCREAMRHMNTFLVERAPWHDDIHAAVEALDAGDEWKALVLTALVAEQGSTAAQHNLGFALETSKTFHLPERTALAYEMYLRSGGSGDFAPGLTDAAHMVWNGHKFNLPAGTNRTRAVELYEQASRQGDTEATFALARVAEGAGQVAKRNLTRAAELYWEAVEMAPSERFAAAPLLALLLLRLAGYRRLVMRLIAVGARRTAKWDLAVLSALGSGLATVLWLRWHRRRADPVSHRSNAPGQSA